MNNKHLQHIKTPLNIHVRGHRDKFCDIDTSDDYTIVSNIGIEAARRIVACVNRCEGVSTETLETSPDLATAFMSAENARLIHVKDKLLAAMVEYRNDVRHLLKGRFLDLDAVERELTAAISKAEGGA